MVLMDETGKTLPSYHIFKMFIKAFFNHLIEHLDIMGINLTKDDIKCVIPVSAYLKDTGKQFLRSRVEQVSVYFYSTRNMSVVQHKMLLISIFIILILPLKQLFI